MSRPRAVRSGELSVDVFAVGAHSELMHWQFRNGAWTSWPIVGTVGGTVTMASRVVPPTLHRNWESLGGILISPPHAVMFGELNDTILVFALGTDHALWTKASVNGSWRPWDTLGHALSSPPHAVTWRNETFAVFALGTDSAIWYTMGSDWHSLGGAFSSAPYAVSTFNHIHVFAADAHSARKHRSWNGNSWSNWESLGGILMCPPTANSFQNNELIHVYALGTTARYGAVGWVGPHGAIGIRWVGHSSHPPVRSRAYQATFRRGIWLHWAQITRCSTSSFLTRRAWQLLADEDRLLTTRARARVLS